MRRAEVIFIEHPHGGSWSTRLVNAADVRDQQRNGRPVHPGWRARIRQESAGEVPHGMSPGYAYVLQGGHIGGRRHGWAPTLTAAQEAIIRWARRRFYYAD